MLALSLKCKGNLPCEDNLADIFVCHSAHPDMSSDSGIAALVEFGIMLPVHLHN